MKNKKKFAKIAKLEKKRSDTAKPEYDDNGDFAFAPFKKHHRFVKVPISYFLSLEKDSEDLTKLKNILDIPQL